MSSQFVFWSVSHAERILLLLCFCYDETMAANNNVNNFDDVLTPCGVLCGVQAADMCNTAIVDQGDVNMEQFAETTEDDVDRSLVHLVKAALPVLIPFRVVKKLKMMHGWTEWHQWMPRLVLYVVQFVQFVVPEFSWALSRMDVEQCP